MLGGGIHLGVIKQVCKTAAVAQAGLYQEARGIATPSVVDFVSCWLSFWPAWRVLPFRESSLATVPRLRAGPPWRGWDGKVAFMKIVYCFALTGRRGRHGRRCRCSQEALGLHACSPWACLGGGSAQPCRDEGWDCPEHRHFYLID